MTTQPVDQERLLVHNWRVARLTLLGVPGSLAEVYADHLDWHQVARLVQRGCPPRLERMLDALGYQRADVLSASLGGVIAQQLARQAPHRVRRLVLAATGPAWAASPGRRYLVGSLRNLGIWLSGLAPRPRS